MRNLERAKGRGSSEGKILWRTVGLNLCFEDAACSALFSKSVWLIRSASVLVCRRCTRGEIAQLVKRWLWRLFCHQQNNVGSSTREHI